jgi:hypothetical protein
VLASFAIMFCCQKAQVLVVILALYSVIGFIAAQAITLDVNSVG